MIFLNPIKGRFRAHVEMNYGHEVVCCLNFEIDIKQLDMAFCLHKFIKRYRNEYFKKYGFSELQVFK